MIYMLIKIFHVWKYKISVMLYLFFVSFSLLFASCESSLRIIGGRDAVQNEFPYVVRLEVKKEELSEDTINNYNQFCTGAALTSKWVLSAAHCLYSYHGIYTKNNLFLRYNSYFPDNIGLLAPFLETIRHPGHDPVTMKFDFLLIRSADIKVSQYGKISAVDFKSLVGHEALSLGYGKSNASEFKIPLQVLKGMLSSCLEKEYAMQMLCLLRQCTVETTICGGDSGGPVVHPAGKVGVNSMSVDNCDEDTKDLQLTPGTSASVLSPVSPVLDWIRNSCK